MRREPLSPGLLSGTVFALWALALAIAAWMGLGSRLPASQQPVEQLPLPQMPVLAAERLGDVSHYPQVVERPLFNEGRRPQPYYIGGEPGQASSSVRLSGVLISDRLSMATLSGEGGLSLRLRLGGPAVQGWQLLELSARQATVLGPSGSQILPLAVHAGSAEAAPAPGQPGSNANSSNNSPALPAPAAGTAAPAVARSPSQSASSSASAAPAAAASGNQPSGNQPSADQLQAIRARIQARRAQMQQNNNGSNPGQNR